MVLKLSLSSDPLGVVRSSGTSANPGIEVDGNIQLTTHSPGQLLVILLVNEEEKGGIKVENEVVVILQMNSFPVNR